MVRLIILYKKKISFDFFPEKIPLEFTTKICDLNIVLSKACHLYCRAKPISGNSGFGHIEVLVYKKKKFYLASSFFMKNTLNSAKKSVKIYIKKKNKKVSKNNSLPSDANWL